MKPLESKITTEVFLPPCSSPSCPLRPLPQLTTPKSLSPPHSLLPLALPWPGLCWKERARLTLNWRPFASISIWISSLFQPFSFSLQLLSRQPPNSLDFRPIPTQYIRSFRSTAPCIPLTTVTSFNISTLICLLLLHPLDPPRLRPPTADYPSSLRRQALTVTAQPVVLLKLPRESMMVRRLSFFRRVLCFTLHCYCLSGVLFTSPCRFTFLLRPSSSLCLLHHSSHTLPSLYTEHPSPFTRLAFCLKPVLLASYFFSCFLLPTSCLKPAPLLLASFSLLSCFLLFSLLFPASCFLP